MLAACTANAADPARRRTYRLVTTCSGGYDSNTAAALAARLGGRLAVTLGSARGGAADSGAPVAEALGLTCVERERTERASGGSEVEFLTPGTGGADSPLALFEAELDGALLLTGYHGDKVWEQLLERSVLVRNCANWPRLDGCLRVTVGTATENDAFLSALREVLG